EASTETCPNTAKRYAGFSESVLVRGVPRRPGAWSRVRRRRVRLAQGERREGDPRQHWLAEARLVQQLFVRLELGRRAPGGPAEELPHVLVELKRAAAADRPDRRV